MCSGGSGPDSDVTRSVSDSGISLVDPSDSGLSLEKGDLLAGSKLASKVESLDLGGDDLIALDDDADLSESPTQLKADDDFLLTPAEEAPMEESSGSQVIALDSDLDFDESSATMVGQGQGLTPLEEIEDSEEAVSLSSGACRPACRRAIWGPVWAAAADFGHRSGADHGSHGRDASRHGNRGLEHGPVEHHPAVHDPVRHVAFDLMRNMWSWNGAYSVNSSLMDMILSWFETNKRKRDLRV